MHNAQLTMHNFTIYNEMHKYRRGGDPPLVLINPYHRYIELWGWRARRPRSHCVTGGGRPYVLCVLSLSSVSL